jgi:hypothetical protein
MFQRLKVHLVYNYRWQRDSPLQPRPNLGGPLSLLYKAYCVTFPGVEQAGAWR